MTLINSLLNSDDHFILGNIALHAVRKGLGVDVLNIINVLKTEFPKNANAPLLEATYLESIGETQSAIEVLEEFGVFSADQGRENAVAFRLHLLVNLNQTELAVSLGKAYLEDGTLTTESARHMARQVLADCGVELAPSTQEVNHGHD